MSQYPLWFVALSGLFFSLLTSLQGADIQFRRHARLDVCLAVNHNIALFVYPMFCVFLS
jgi:hypothetical protein